MRPETSARGFQAESLLSRPTTYVHAHLIRVALRRGKGRRAVPLRTETVLKSCLFARSGVATPRRDAGCCIQQVTRERELLRSGPREHTGRAIHVQTADLGELLVRRAERTEKRALPDYVAKLTREDANPRGTPRARFQRPGAQRPDSCASLVAMMCSTGGATPGSDVDSRRPRRQTAPQETGIQLARNARAKRSELSCQHRHALACDVTIRAA